MSWFGGGLSSITGQLSNLTKDILAEGTEEVEDPDAQLRVARNTVKELEALVHSQRAEIDRLKSANDELTVKTESAELQIQHLRETYKKELTDKDAQITTLKNQLAGVRGEPEGQPEMKQLYHHGNGSNQPMGSSVPADDEHVIFHEPSDDEEFDVAPRETIDMAYEFASEDHMGGAGGQLQYQVSKLQEEVDYWKTLSQQKRQEASASTSDDDEDQGEVHPMKVAQHAPSTGDARQHDTRSAQTTVTEFRDVGSSSQPDDGVERMASCAVQTEAGDLERRLTFADDSIKQLEEEQICQEKRPSGRQAEDSQARGYEEFFAQLKTFVSETEVKQLVNLIEHIQSLFGQEKWLEQLKCLVDGQLPEDVHGNKVENTSGRISHPRKGSVNEVEDVNNASYHPGQSKSPLSPEPSLSGYFEADTLSQFSDLSEVSVRSRQLEEHVKHLAGQIVTHESQLAQAVFGQEPVDGDIDNLRVSLQKKRDTMKLLVSKQTLLRQKRAASLQKAEAQRSHVDNDLAEESEDDRESWEGSGSDDEENRKNGQGRESSTETVLHTVTNDYFEKIKDLQKTLQEAKENNARKISELSDELEKKDQELFKASKLMSYLNHAIQDLGTTQALSSLSSPLDRVKAFFNEMRELQENYKHTHVELNLLKSSLQEKDDLCSDLDGKVQTLQTQNKSLMKALDESREEREAAIQRYVEEAKVLGGINDNLRAEVSVLQQKSDGQGSDDEVYRLQITIEKLQEDKWQLGEQFTSLRKEYDAILDELKDADKLKMELDASNDRLQELSEQLSAAQRFMGSLRGVLVSRVNLTADIDEWPVMLQGLLEDMEECQTAGQEDVESRLNESLSNCQNLEQENQLVTEEINRLREELKSKEEAQRDLENLRLQLEQVHIDFNESKSTISALDEENTGLQSVMASMKDQIDLIKIEKQRLLQEKTDVLQESLDKSVVVEEAETLRAQLNDSLTWNEKYQLRIDELESQLEALDAHIKANESRPHLNDSLVSSDMFNNSSQSLALSDAASTKEDKHAQSDESVELQHLCAQKDNQVTELKTACEKLETELNVVRHQEIQHRQSNAVLNKGIQEIKGKVETLYLERDQLRRELDNLLSQIQKNSEEISETVGKKVDSHTSTGDIESQATGSQTDFCHDSKEDKEIELKSQPTSAQPASETLSANYDNHITDDILSLTREVESLRDEKRKLEGDLGAKIREIDHLKDELQGLIGTISSQSEMIDAINKEKCHLEQLVARHEGSQGMVEDDDMTKEAIRNLSHMVRDKEWEIEALKRKNESLLEVLQNSPAPESPGIGSDNNSAVSMKKLLEERENLTKQLKMFQQDREQIIAALNQKHQESVAYHTEIQRLMSYIGDEKAKWDAYQNEKFSLLKREKELKNSLAVLEEELSRLRIENNELTVKHEAFQTSGATMIPSFTSSDGTSKQTDRLKQMLTSKEDEIHRLRGQSNSLEESNREKTVEITSLRKAVERVTFQLGEAQIQVSDLRGNEADFERKIQEQENELTLLREQSSQLALGEQERAAEVTRLRATGEGSAEQIAGGEEIARLTSERDQLSMALKQKLAEVHNARQEMARLHEREVKLTNELQRLRDHLLQVEEGYTHEAMQAEDRERSLRERLHQVEERSVMSSQVMEQVTRETQNKQDALGQQLVRALAEKEAALGQLARCQLDLQSQAVSLRNLQSVLDNFQRENDNTIAFETERYIKEINRLKIELDELKNKDLELTNQLAAQTDVIEAAQRLTDQMDRKEQALHRLQEIIHEKEKVIDGIKGELKQMNTSSEAKIDKILMKNLVVGYFHTPPHMRKDAMRVIGSLLHFTDDEYTRVGVDVANKSGWFSWLRRQPSPPKRSGESQADQSFTHMFINFLERESTPTPQLRINTDQLVAEVQRQHTYSAPASPTLFKAPAPQAQASAESQADHALVIPANPPRPSSAGGTAWRSDPMKNPLLSVLEDK